MATVRAKFTCIKKEKVGENGYRIELTGVTSGSKENESFFMWTPAATVKLETVSELAAATFEEGKEFYGDFSPAITAK